MSIEDEQKFLGPDFEVLEELASALRQELDDYAYQKGMSHSRDDQARWVVSQVRAIATKLVFDHVSERERHEL